MNAKLAYANSWEDAHVLLGALADRRHGNLLSIAAAGDNCLSLLTLQPEKIVAIDYNPLQLACLHLKMAAIRCLEHEQLLAFLGIKPCCCRLDYYEQVRKTMPSQYSRLMDQRTRDIARGIIFSGKLEHYLSVSQRFVLPLLWRKSVINELFSPVAYEERKVRISRELQRRGWQLVLKFFFSKPVISLLGRDKSKFKHAEGKIQDILRQRIRHVLIELPSWENPYLNFIARGNYDHMLPHYLQPEHFPVIKKQLDKIHTVEGDLATYLHSNPNTRYTGFLLSDIFEYLNIAQTNSIFSALVRQAAPGARLVYWNMMVDRRSAHPRIRCLDQLSRELFQKDQVMFYKNLFVEEVA